MDPLIFSIDQETCKGQVDLVLRICPPFSEKLLYLSEVELLAKKDPLLSFLLKEACQPLQMPVFRIPKDNALESLHKLIIAKRLLWKERSLFFNPISQGKAMISLSVESVDVETLFVTGFICFEGRVEPASSVDFFLLGHPIFGVCKQVLFVLSKEVKPSFIRNIYPQESFLSGKERKLFLEEFQEDPPSFIKEITWKGDFLTPKISALPLLRLRDIHGAFADLWMDYGDRQVDYQDPSPFSGRDPALEKSWEKDLLETGFQRKEAGSSSYYCPMDQVGKSLSFLLELGWTIVDRQGKKLCLLTDSKVSIGWQKDAFVVKGTFHYQDYEADLQKVLGAFNRKERFIDLSDAYVGWIDPSHKAYEGVEDLIEAERVQEGCRASLSHCGLLSSLIKRKEVDIEAETKLLLDRLLLGEQSKEDQEISFQGTLRPYQEEGVRWLLFLQKHRLSGLLADEMGLGKTIQALAFFSSLSFSSPILIVVPTSLLFNWEKEWQTFVPRKQLYVHEGKYRTKDRSFLEKQEAILVSYALLRVDADIFLKLSFSCTLLDEAQWMKNPESQLAKVLCSLSSSMRICLTGTPIENRAEDLWSLFHFLQPQLLGGRKEFVARLQAVELKKLIQKKIRPFFLRRLKEEVASDLPEKIEQTLWVQMEEDQRAFYEDFLSKAKSGVLRKVQLEGVSSHRMEVLEVILRLRQICCHPLLIDLEAPLQMSGKLQRVLEDLEEVVSSGKKVLVYSQFTKMLHLLAQQLQTRGWRYAYLDGQTKHREEAVTSFQTDPKIPIFLMSLKAGGVGLNLTAADYVFLLDPWWNEAAERQAIDRAHRLGRKDVMIARRYVCASTIEEKIMALKSHKSSLAKGLLEGGEVAVLDLQSIVNVLFSE